jgi:hypothetical protein
MKAPTRIGEARLLKNWAAAALRQVAVPRLESQARSAAGKGRDPGSRSPSVLTWVCVALCLSGGPTAAAEAANVLAVSRPRGSNDLFSVLVPTAAGKTNLLEGAESLAVPNWLPLHVIQGTGEVQVVDVLPAAGQQFFRLAELRKSSLDLIDAALERGQITAETAAVYRVYVLFHDERLPSMYRGDDSNVRAFPALEEAAAAFSTLSTNAQSLLQPFFIPPAYVGSWADRYQTNGGRLAPRHGTKEILPPNTFNAGWMNVSTPHVKLWYRTLSPGVLDPQAAQAAVEDCEHIWGELAGLFGVTPPSDSGELHNGGDGRLDIYVFADPASGLSASGPEGMTLPWAKHPGHPGPRFILLWKDSLSRCLTLAHEMTHAFLAQFPLLKDDWRRYAWLDEATAAWASDYLYPRTNCEHRLAPQYLELADAKTDRRRVELPLDTEDPAVLAYGHYVFPFYIAHAAGGPQVIANIWRNCKDQEPLPAIDTALQPKGGLDKVWHDFALANGNTPPVDNYMNWDSLAARASTRAGHALKGPATIGRDLSSEYSLVTLPGQTEVIYALDAVVDYMAATYYRFVFRDAEVRSVAFYNPFKGMPHVAVQALYRVEGQAWRLENWTYTMQRNFCRDLKAERLEELLVIISNSDFATKQPLPADKIPLLMANNLGCYKWSGQETGSDHLEEAGSIQEWNHSAPLTFQLEHPEFGTFNNEVFLVYTKVTPPVFAWDGFVEGPPVLPGIRYQCTWAAASYQTDPASAGGSLVINNFLIPGVVYPPDMLDPGLPALPRLCRGGFSGTSSASVPGVGGDPAGGAPCPDATPGWGFSLPADPNLTALKVEDDGRIIDNETVVLFGGIERVSQHATLTPVRQ